MNIFLTLTITAMMLTMVMMSAAFILSSRHLTDREKVSPFECGFDPKNTARIPFSMRFFLLAIIFIVFDIEIMLLIPIPLLLNLIHNSMLIIMFIFILILIMGLLHEWNEGSLDWST